MAFTYGIFGRVSLRWVLIVVMVSTVVTPEHSSTHRKQRVHRQEEEVRFQFQTKRLQFRSVTLVQETILHCKKCGYTFGSMVMNNIF